MQTRNQLVRGPRNKLWLALLALAAALAAGPAQAQVPTISITAGPNALEGYKAGYGGFEGHPAVFVLTAVPAPANGLTVALRVDERGRFIAGAAPTRAIFAAGAARATLNVATENDAVAEADGRIRVSLVTGNGYRRDPAQRKWVSYGIRDNDTPLVSLAGNPRRQEEGASGEFSLKVRTRPGFAGWPLSVRVEVAETGSMLAAGQAGVRSFAVPDAATTAITFTVATDNDGASEPSSRISLAILPSQSYEVRRGPRSWAVDDNDGGASALPPEAGITISAGPNALPGYKAGYGGFEGHPAVFILTAEPPPANGLTVALNVRNTGKNQGVFIAAAFSTEVTFAAGAASATLRVATENDEAPEADGGVRVSLVDGGGYRRAPQPKWTSYAIRDNDTALVHLSGHRASGPAEGASSTFSIRIRTEPGFTERALQVRVRVSETGDMLASGQAGVRIVTVMPGAADAAFTVQTHDDGASEPGSSISAEILPNAGQPYEVRRGPLAWAVDDNDPSPSPAPGQGRAPARNLVVIHESLPQGERLPLMSIRPVAAAVAEGQPARFAITAVGPVREPLTLRYLVADALDDALAASEEGAKTLVFPAGSSALVLEVPTAEDEALDDQGRVTVTLQPAGKGAGYHLAAAPGQRAAVSVEDSSAAAIRRRAKAALLPQLALALADQSSQALRARMGAALSAGDPVSGLALGGASPADFLQGLSFATRLASYDAGNQHAAGGLTFWGRGLVGSLAADDGRTDFNAGLGGFVLGLDHATGSRVLGLAMVRTTSEADYARSGLAGEQQTRITGLHPYFGLRRQSGASLWASLGFGSGALQMSGGHERREEQATDVATTSLALGVDKPLVKGLGGNPDGLDLSFKGDLLYAGVVEDGVEGLDATSGRLRLGLGLAKDWQRASGSVLDFSLDLAYRQDFGAAASGSGLELATGLDIRLASGLTLDLAYRSLLFGAEDASDWGVSASLAYNPSESARGFSVTFTPLYGQTQSRAAALWQNAPLASGLAPSQPANTPELTYALELKYGVALSAAGSDLLTFHTRTEARDLATRHQAYIRYQRTF